jgi:urea carboxylase
VAGAPQLVADRCAPPRAKPRWARSDGGDAGLHPSNIHDTGYAIGAVDLTGDMPIVLGPDGPSLGGFVCPLVVAASERWKLGQLRPGATVRFVAMSAAAAAAADSRRRAWLARAVEPIAPVARPVWNARLRASGTPEDAVLARSGGVDGGTTTTYRQAGDRFLLVELGEMALDLELRLRVHALDRWAHDHLGDGLVDVTPGVRSLLVQVDGTALTVAKALAALRRAEEEVVDVAEQAFPARTVHLPLSWDDPATREAVDRYVHGVRPDAPWCPENIEFIRRINGLASVEDVRRTVLDASYLVLGLGDVYLGAPVATPIDPRHRLVTTKYNPARTWTPENAVGIGGAYLCIYGMEGPGGYQLVGRTVQVWNRHRRGPHFTEPWLLRPFDQLRWHLVAADELLDMRAEQAAGTLRLRIDESPFRLADHQRALAAHAEEIDRFTQAPARGLRSRAPGVGRRRRARARRWLTSGRRRPSPTPSTASPPTGAPASGSTCCPAAGCWRRLPRSRPVRRQVPPFRSQAGPWRSRATSTWRRCGPPPGARPTAWWRQGRHRPSARSRRRARSSSAPRTSTSSPRGSSARARRTAPARTHTGRRWSRAARARGRPSPSPPAWSTSASAPTPPAPGGCRPPPTGSSA